MNTKMKKRIEDDNDLRRKVTKAKLVKTLYKKSTRHAYLGYCCEDHIHHFGEYKRAEKQQWATEVRTSVQDNEILRS